MLTTYIGHGLRIASDIDLPLQVTGGSPGPYDIELVRAEEKEIVEDAPGGEILAQLGDYHKKVHYTFARNGQQTVLRYTGLCEFVGDRGLRHIRAHLTPGADAGYLSVLGSGAVLAVHLALKGHLVLHASAVRLGTQALAFVGASGMGKSTMASLMCADGYELVTDDVLRVAPVTSGQPVTVYPGGIESRLRDKASSLAGLVARDASRRTADGRVAVRPRVYSGEPLELAACVVPLPNPAATSVTSRRLSEGSALRRLLRYPRIGGWTEGTSLVSDFEALADLVSQVPVFEVVVPWGPPFRPEIGRAVLSDLGICPSPSGNFRPATVTQTGG